MAEKIIHEGRNIKRIREMLGIKQDALAAELGDDWTQGKISILEQKETVDPTILQQVAQVLKVPVEAIKNFDEQTAINIISNTFNNSSHDSSSFYSSAINYQPTFNPVDKVIELYERLLQEKETMIQELKKLTEK